MMSTLRGLQCENVKSRFHCILWTHKFELPFCNSLFISSPPSAAYMPQSIRSALVQIMACHLSGTKPLSKQMLYYCRNKGINFGDIWNGNFVQGIWVKLFMSDS